MGTDIAALVTAYEVRQDDDSFQRAIEALDSELAKAENAQLLRDRGYILFSRARVTMREALGWYRRSLVLEPDAEKTHLQLIVALAALGDVEDAISTYKERLAARPNDVSSHRLLAEAYLRAGDLARANVIVAAGLTLAPDHPGLIEQSGTVQAGLGMVDEALATWRQAASLDPNTISALFSRAFLLERLGRIPDAISEWEAILAWSRERSYELDSEWASNELERLRSRLGETPPT